MPRLNFLRKNFWKFNKQKINVITCPSLQLLKKLKDTNIFDNEKLYFFYLMLFFKSKISLNKKKQIKALIYPKIKKNILGIGRLTKQKKF